VWADEGVNKKDPRRLSGRNDWGDYSFCSQLIEWDDGPSLRYIRLAYFRRRAGEKHWEFASQMSIASDVKTMQALLKKTLNKGAWFRKSKKKT
jgi:hypothetical protein